MEFKFIGVTLNGIQIEKFFEGDEYLNLANFIVSWDKIGDPVVSYSLAAINKG